MNDAHGDENFEFSDFPSSSDPTDIELVPVTEFSVNLSQQQTEVKLETDINHVDSIQQEQPAFEIPPLIPSSVQKSENEMADVSSPVKAVVPEEEVDDFGEFDAAAATLVTDIPAAAAVLTDQDFGDQTTQVDAQASVVEFSQEKNDSEGHVRQPTPLYILLVFVVCLFVCLVRGFPFSFRQMISPKRRYASLSSLWLNHTGIAICPRENTGSYPLHDA